MAGNNSTRIVLTAEDRASAAIGAVNQKLGSLGGAAAQVIPQLSALSGALTLGGIAAFAKHTIDAADNLNDLSKRVSVGVRNLAEWRLAAEQNGTTLETMGTGLRNLSVYMVEHGDKLRAAGITAKDARGALLQLSDLFKAMPEGPERTALAVEVFKRAGMEMLPVLLEGSEGLAASAAKSQEYAKRLEELAPKADQFNDHLAEMKINAESLGLSLTNKLMPGLNGLLQWLNDVTAGGEKAKNALDWMADDHPSPLMRGLANITRFARGMGNPGQGWNGPLNAHGLPDMAQPGPLMLPGANSQAEADALRRASMVLSGGKKKRETGSVDDLQSRIAARVGAAINDSDIAKANELALAIEHLDRLYFEAGLDLEVYTSTMAKLTGMQADKTVDRLNELLADTPTAKIEEARKDMLLLADAFERGKIGAEQFSEAAQARLGTLGDTVKETNDIARDLGMTFTSAFEDAVINGKRLSDVLKGLAQDVARIFLRKTVTERLANAIGGLLSVGTSSEPWRQAGLDFFVPQYAAGTPYVPEDQFAFLHKGEAVIPAEHNNGGGVTVNIINQTAAKVTAREGVSDGKREITLLVQDTVAALMSSGALDGSMRRNFGAGRVGVLRG